MKRRLWTIGLAMVALLAARPLAAPAQTDGSLRFRYTVTDPSGNYSAFICAAWVDGTGTNHIKSRQWSTSSRRGYLYTFIREAKSNNVDAVSGGTYSGTKVFTNTWNCRDLTNNLIPDGSYQLRLEMTDRNSQGPISPNNHIRFTKGSSAWTNTYPGTNQFSNIEVLWSPLVVSHDIGVRSLTVPAIVSPGTNYAIPVVVTNKGTVAETFVLSLSNQTASALIGSTTITSLAALGSRTNSFTWNTTALATGPVTVVAYAAPVTGETATGDNTMSASTTARVMFHDTAIPRFTVPVVAVPGATTNLTLLATNRGDFAETFTVLVTDRTDRVLIGFSLLSALPAYAGTNLTVSWNTTGRTPGVHELAAIATVGASDIDHANNTNVQSVVLALGLATNTLVARRGTWRYNDKGLNLHDGPWTSADYYDGHWGVGAGPLGYGDPWIVTTNSYGPDPNRKYPCLYYRNTFALDAIPLSLTLRVARDDGVAVYLNGVEALRDNLDPVAGYADLATATASGTAESNYVDYAVDTSLLRVGLNILAAEVHQDSTNSTDSTFDLEVSCVSPILSTVHDVSVNSVSPRGTAIPGDRLDVAVNVGNPGGALETFNVTLTDTNTATTIGTQAVSMLLPGETRTVVFAWDTLGVAPGAHTLRAAAATVSGETNTANNAAAAAASVTGSGFELAPPNVTGSIGGFCGAVALSGTTAYLGEGATLTVLDVTTPSAPVVLGRLRLNGAIEGLAVAGTTVFAAAGAAGVHFVDASSPGAMVLRATFNTSGHAHGVAAAGTRLYVADGVGGLRIVDVASPSSPVLLGALATIGPARAIWTDGTTAYLVDQHEGLLVLNVSSPAAITRTGVCRLVAEGESLAVSGSYAYVGDGEGKLNVVNLTTPSAPVLATNLVLAGQGLGVAIGPASHLFVAAGAAGVQPVNVSSPAAPVLLAAADTPGEATAIAISGSTAFVADGFGGLRILNVSAPSAPALLATAGSGLRARHSAVTTNGIVYVAAGEKGIEIYDVSAAGAPVRIGGFAGAGDATGVALAGGRLFVADGLNGLRIADLTTPSNLTLRATYTNAAVGAMRCVAATATRAVVTDGRVVHAVDVTDPSAPSPAGTFDAAGPTLRCFIHDLAVAGTRVVAAAGADGLMVFDPANAARQGWYNGAKEATGVAGAGTTAYVADGTNGWLAVDVSTPSAPGLVGAVHPGHRPIAHIAATAALVHLGDASMDVHAMDVSAPLTPVEKGSFLPLTRIMKVAAANTLALAAEDDAGMAVIDVAPNDHNLNGLPDSYDQQIVDANPSDAITSIADVQPGDDFDGDGQSNQQEYIAGTSPTDPASVFACVAGAGLPSGSQFIVRWSSVVGKNYSVFRSTNLVSGAGFQPIATGIPGNGSVNSHTTTVQQAGTYFMVGVE